jgi:hypothetical protein
MYAHLLPREYLKGKDGPLNIAREVKVIPGLFKGITEEGE